MKNKASAGAWNSWHAYCKRPSAPATPGMDYRAGYDAGKRAAQRTRATASARKSKRSKK